jgi:hypothetical protein
MRTTWTWLPFPSGVFSRLVRLKGTIGMMTEYRNVSVNVAIKTVDMMKISELRHLRNGVSRNPEHLKIPFMVICQMEATGPRCINDIK